MRDKLRKRIALSAVTALTLFAAVPVYADTYDAVYDDAALLSDAVSYTHLTLPTIA